MTDKASGYVSQIYADTNSWVYFKLSDTTNVPKDGYFRCIKAILTLRNYTRCCWRRRLIASFSACIRKRRSQVPNTLTLSGLGLIGRKSQS